jgi:hypothetical protein
MNYFQQYLLVQFCNEFETATSSNESFLIPKIKYILTINDLTNEMK